MDQSRRKRKLSSAISCCSTEVPYENLTDKLTIEVSCCSTAEAPVYENLIDKLTLEIQTHKIMYGAVHPSVAESLNSLALVYHHMLNDSAQALEYHQQALSVLTTVRTTGTSHIEEKDLAIKIAVTTSDIANAQWALSHHEDAEQTFADALNLLEQENIPKSHPRSYAIRNRLCALYRHSDELHPPKRAHIANLVLPNNPTPPPSSGSEDSSSPSLMSTEATNGSQAGTMPPRAGC